MVTPGWLLWLRHDPPVGVRLMMWHSPVAKTDILPIGSKDEKLFITDGFQDFLVESHSGFVVVRVDAHLGVIDHIGAKGYLQYNS